MDAKEQIKIIRKAIKSKPELKNVMVRNGRGTAWVWVDITGGGEWGNSFTAEERKALRQYFNINPGDNFAVISPEFRATFIEKYCS